MIDRATGIVRFADGSFLGPEVRLADFERAQPSLQGTPSEPRYPFLPGDGREYAFENRIEGAGRFHVAARFFGGMLAEIDLCLKDDDRVRRAAELGRPRELAALRRAHRRLLRRRVGGAPSNSFVWGQANECFAEPQENHPDMETRQGTDIIRLDYVMVAPEPVSVPWRWMRRAAFACALAGPGLMVWARMWRSRLIESPDVLDAMWLGAVGLLFAAIGLRLAWEWIAGDVPGSTEEAMRWPCRDCRDFPGFLPRPLVPVEPPSADGYDRRKCQTCGAVFSSDALSQHPRAAPGLPPQSETERRWPFSQGPLRKAPRFRIKPPGTRSSEESEIELRAFVLALESCLQATPGFVALFSALFGPAALTLLLHGTVSDSWLILGVAAFVLATAGMIFFGALDVHLHRRRFALVCRPQIVEYLERTGTPRSEFVKSAIQIAGWSSRLANMLGAGGSPESTS